MIDKTESLTPAALTVIDGYMRLKIGAASAGVPYFNNKTVRARMSLRVKVGKGSPTDITEEITAIITKQHVSAAALTDQSLAKLLVDSGLGIDCSGFSYHVLDAESQARGQGHLNKHLRFMKANNPMTKMLSYLRPVENCDVRTLGSDMNSRIVALSDVRPGDMITMVGGPGGDDRNHILVIREVDREDGIPRAIRYSHAVAYPEDGLYGTGIKQGAIEIAFPKEPLTKQIWTEGGSAEKARLIFERAQASVTELRRLKWLL